ncbi:MAG: lamin tail domain-containing protein [Solirubrobacterales bacterium]
MDEATLRAAYGIPSTVRVFGPWTGSLKNGGERVSLKDKNGVTVSTVSYDDRGHWSPAPDGTGHTLVLKNPVVKIDDWRNWRASARPGGTPGSEEAEAAETPVSSPEVNLSVGMPYVTYGDTWKYNDKNVDLGTAWRAPNYDDSSWSQGPGLFGFENASLPSPGIRTPFTNSQQLTYYLRKEFAYNGDIQGATISVNQILDDGAVYYLNGKEIGRSGMSEGTVTFTTAAGRTTGDAVEEQAVIVTDGSALVNGLNVLAVEVHQINTTSSDVVFGMQLNISAPSRSDLLINEVLPGVAGVGFIEIYNPGTSTINLRDYYLTDSATNLRKFRITQDIILPADGLATVGFAESGFAVSNPVSVCLVAPDGATMVNVIVTAMPMDGRSLGRKPTGGTLWYLFTEPTRGTANLSQEAVVAEIHLNEAHFDASQAVDWVELYNSSEDRILLDGLFLASSADLSDQTPLSGSIPAGGHASFDVVFPAPDGEVTLFLVNSSGSVLSARALERPMVGNCLQVYPEGSDEWYASTQSTRDAANEPARNTDVVINEILYDPPSNESSGEFIELCNRSDAAIDVSGWRFVEGVDFTIPAGTTIPAQGCLAVAADANWVRATYGDVPVVGDFEGRLSNQGELIRLVDSQGNLVDEVDYFAGGNWPDLADGRGSSMELRNPWMDNSRPSAWRDSDETGRMDFQHYSYSDVYRQLRTLGAVTDYKELHFYLVGDSHVILKNIQVRLNGTGSNLIANGNKMSTDGRSANGWLAQGTHYASYLNGQELHLVSDGHGDNRPNRVEIDVTGMQANQKYEISFDARWVSGMSRLIVQTWDHSIATSISLPVPADIGTPGAPNTCFDSGLAPQVDELMHSPTVPASGQAVTVTARVLPGDGVNQVLLCHRLDNSVANGAWAVKSMFDDGVSGGDETAGDGVYTAQLTEYGQSGQIVQFYIQAASSNGLTCQQPKDGASRPAMYVVGSTTAPGDLRRMRFVISAADVQEMSGGDGASSAYGYAFPRLSNHYFNATIIVDEKDVIYGCEIRPAGSPWTRGGGLDRAKFKFPDDHLFRGKGNLLYRNYDVGWWSHDRIVRYWLYLLGNPTPENEFIQVRINNGGTAVREEVEVVGNDFLNRVYENGSQGELYKIDDEWWFQDDWNRESRDADWSYKSSDNSGRYHSEWMKRTRENEDDYSALISFFKKVYVGPYTQAEIERLVDPVALLKSCAVGGYIHAWDFFSLNRGKNCYFYRRSTDGRFMFFPWDMKRSFDDYNAAFYSGMTGFRPYLEKPYNMRLFKHYLTRLLENYTLNSARVYAWLQYEEAASNQVPFNYSYASWFANRQNPAFNLLGASRTVAFSVDMGGRSIISTNAATVSLTGVAPLRVFKVEVAGHSEAQFSWTSESAWSLANIALLTGSSELTVNGVDEFGAILHQTKVPVKRTSAGAPVMAVTADWMSWQVPVSEPLTMDVSGSYDPDGTAIQYTWSVAPTDASLEVVDQNVAVAAFPRPGLYTIAVEGVDGSGASTTIEREAAAYDAGGLSEFDTLRLEPFWNVENAILRTNYTTGPYYSLTEAEDHLILQVWDSKAYPLAAASPTYPLVWREAPASTDWAFITDLSLKGQVFGDYTTGVLVEVAESGGLTRYVFGIEDGTSLTVRRITASGVGSLLKTVAWNVSNAVIRVRRTGNGLFFEQRVDDVWVSLHSVALPAGSTATKAGLTLATDTAQSVKIAFDYAMLIDSGSDQ